MIIYTGKYTESESDIQNNKLEYKTHQKKTKYLTNNSSFYFIRSIVSIIHIL